MGNAETLAYLRERIRTIESGSSVSEESSSCDEEPTSVGASKRRCKEKLGGPQDVSEADETSRALKRILGLVNVSEKSSMQVHKKLSVLGFEHDVIEEALARAIDYGYVSDERFAASLIRSRLAQGRGEAGIRRELLEHGIELDDVAGWPWDFDYDESEEAKRAYDFICKHPSRSKNLREGAYRKLIQKGYSSSAASDAARKWAEERR